MRPEHDARKLNKFKKKEVKFLLEWRFQTLFRCRINNGATQEAKKVENESNLKEAAPTSVKLSRVLDEIKLAISPSEKLLREDEARLIGQEEVRTDHSVAQLTADRDRYLAVQRRLEAVQVPEETPRPLSSLEAQALVLKSVPENEGAEESVTKEMEVVDKILNASTKKESQVSAKLEKIEGDRIALMDKIEEAYQAGDSDVEVKLYEKLKALEEEADGIVRKSKIPTATLRKWSKMDKATRDTKMSDVEVKLYEKLKALVEGRAGGRT